MVCRFQNSVVCPPENSVVSSVILQSRSQTTSPRTRYEGAHGIAQYVRARQGRNARLTVRSETNSVLRSGIGAAVLSRSSILLDSLLFGRCSSKSMDSCTSAFFINPMVPLLSCLYQGQGTPFPNHQGIGTVTPLWSKEPEGVMGHNSLINLDTSVCV